MLVIFAFLASVRATLVPAVTIPVAVIGAFIGIYALGFSINVLTLLALILAIGIVVDDAIVVLENIQRRIELGESPLVASVLGTRQVTFAVIATSLTLIAVFVPLSFLEGEVGRLFIEFGFVLAAAVAISMLVALSLCPALCTKLLKGGEERGRAARMVERALGVAMRGYRALLRRALDAPVLVLLVAALVSGASFGLYQALPQGAGAGRGSRRVLRVDDRAAGCHRRLHRCRDAQGRGDRRARCARAASPSGSSRSSACAARRIAPSSWCAWPTGTTREQTPQALTQLAVRGAERAARRARGRRPARRASACAAAARRSRW